jgi:hypothetical protein
MHPQKKPPMLKLPLYTIGIRSGHFIPISRLCNELADDPQWMHSGTLQILCIEVYRSCRSFDSLLFPHQLWMYVKTLACMLYA